MVRLSDSPIVNVTSGGDETGFFVIEGATTASDISLSAGAHQYSKAQQ